MIENHIQLNEPSAIGDYLKQCGITTIRIIPTVVVGNDSTTANIYVSYKTTDRLMKIIENLIIYKDEA